MKHYLLILLYVLEYYIILMLLSLVIFLFLLFEKINSVLAAPREKYEYLMSHTAELDKILADGAARADVVANKTIERVRHAMLG